MSREYDPSETRVDRLYQLERQIEKLFEDKAELVERMARQKADAIMQVRRTQHLTHQLFEASTDYAAASALLTDRGFRRCPSCYANKTGLALTCPTCRGRRWIRRSPWRRLAWWFGLSPAPDERQ